VKEKLDEHIGRAREGRSTKVQAGRVALVKRDPIARMKVVPPGRLVQWVRCAGADVAATRAGGSD
jgi:hypothetical protein